MIYQNKKFLCIGSHKKQVYITSPCQPLILMYYKEKLLQPIKHLGYGICINKNMRQQEKISLVAICHPLNASKFFEETIITSQQFFQSLNMTLKVIKRLPKLMRLSSSIQIDFFSLYKGHEIKVFSCTNHTNFFSGNLQIKMNDLTYASIITAKLCNIDILTNILSLHYF